MLSVSVRESSVHRKVRYAINLLGCCCLTEAFIGHPEPAMSWAYFGVVLKAGIVCGLLNGLLMFIRLQTTYNGQAITWLEPLEDVYVLFAIAFAGATVFRVRVLPGGDNWIIYAVPELIWWFIVANLCVVPGTWIFARLIVPAAARFLRARR